MAIAHSSQELGVAAIAISKWSSEQQDAKQYTEDLTNTLDVQTGALTTNTRAFVYNGLEKSGALDIARKYGVSLGLVTDAALGNTDALNELSTAYAKYKAIATSSASSPEELAASADAAGKAAAYERILAEVGHQTGEVAKSEQNWRDEQSAGLHTQDSVNDSLDDTINNLQDLVETQTESIDSTVAMQNAIASLGQSLYENGTSFDAFSAAGRQNLGALSTVIDSMVKAAGGDANTLAVLLTGLMQSLAGYGVDAVNQLGFVQSMIAQLTGGKGVGGLYGVSDAAKAAGNALSQGFSAGATKAAKSAKSTQKEVKTLSDYVSDLSSTINEAFNFRFGLSQSLDDVSESWQKFADYSDEAAQSVADARQQIDELHTTLQGLQADRNILEYQLKVATEYGDTLRANDIIAELAKNTDDQAKANSDLTDQSKDLSKAQKALDKNLDGTTTQSRDQRDMVTSLLEAYQKQITALANTGISQTQLGQEVDRLKTKFTTQLTSMGYAQTQVDDYAQSFDDLSRIIAGVPRNLTVSVNADPALRALDEYLAKLNTARSQSDIGTTISGPSDAFVNNWWTDLASRIKNQIAKQPVAVDGYLIQGQQVYRIPGTGLKLYDSGGYTGRGGKYEPAGIVHKGEYVVPAQYVNQTTGLPFAGVLGSMLPTHNTTNNYYSGGHVSGAPAVQLVELMPYQVAQIVDGLAVRVELDSKALANTTNNVNATSARRGSN